jgi:hypothetical protein
MEDFNPRDDMQMDQMEPLMERVEEGADELEDASFSPESYDLSRRRGSVPPPEEIPEADRNSVEGMQKRLDDLRSEGKSSKRGSLRKAIEATEKLLNERGTELFQDYAKRKGYDNIETPKAVFNIDKKGSIWAKYEGQVHALTKENLSGFYELNYLASNIKGRNPGATKFIQEVWDYRILGVRHRLREIKLER